MASKHLWGTKLTSNDSSAKEQLGAVRKEWNSTDECFKIYKYVRASIVSQGSGRNGLAYGWYDVLGQVATDDVSTTSANLPAGVGIGTLTHNYYGWIQIGGYHSSVKTSGEDNFADGSFAVLSSLTDSSVSHVAAGTAASVKIMGIAVTADTDADNKVSLLLDCSYGDIIQ